MRKAYIVRQRYEVAYIDYTVYADNADEALRRYDEGDYEESDISVDEPCGVTIEDVRESDDEISEDDDE